MYAEDELLPLSGLQHLIFCERQAALIHIEQLWGDNFLTIEGSHLHRRVDQETPRRERRGDIVIVRGLALRSLKLGLAGRADVVEFHRAGHLIGKEGNSIRPRACKLQGIKGLWIPFPVEYKRGKPKAHQADEVQLCAQALCLEEMLDIEINEGALFYGRTRRRFPVIFDFKLRELVEQSALRLHQLVKDEVTPPARKSQNCKLCSLLEICLPSLDKRSKSARSYLSRTMSALIGEEHS